MPSHVDPYIKNNRAVTLLAAALALAIVTIPVWSVNIPPLLDYHNHLARQYVLAKLPESVYLQTFYAANWKATPYLAFDSIVQGLALLLPVEIAGKVFLTLTLLLLGAAPLALNLALFGRATPLALLGLLFVHNTTLTLGFVNNLFGIGFAICLLALWIRFRTAIPILRLTILPLLATLLFFSHLFGFIIYGLTATAFELGHHVSLLRKRHPIAPFRITNDQLISLISLAIQLIIPLSIFLSYGPSTEALSSSTYGSIARKFELLAGAIFYLMPPYAWTWETMLCLLLPASIALLLIFRAAFISASMLWPLAALVGLFFAMPVELFHWGWGADHRLLPALGLMFSGSLALRSEQMRLALPVYAIMVCLVTVRVAAITVEWRKADVEYGQYVRSFDVVPDGSRMFFWFGEGIDKQVGRRPYQHMPTLVLMRRDVFVPLLFAHNSGVFPLRYKAEVEPLLKAARSETVQGRPQPKWGEVLSNFDYVMLVDRHLIDLPTTGQLVTVFEEGRITVYRTGRALNAD